MTSHSRDTSRMTVQCLPQVNTNEGKGKHLGKKHLFRIVSGRSLQEEERGNTWFLTREKKLQSVGQGTLLAIPSAYQTTGSDELGQLTSHPKHPLVQSQAAACTHILSRPALLGSCQHSSHTLGADAECSSSLPTPAGQWIEKIEGGPLFPEVSQPCMHIPKQNSSFRFLSQISRWQ